MRFRTSVFLQGFVLLLSQLLSIRVNLNMKDRKKFIYATLLTLPIILLWFAILNVSQCPESYTQAQIDNSNCIVGANIGLGISILGSVFTWLAAFWLINRVRKSNKRK
jgi:uncharacterized integral membrane protein